MKQDVIGELGKLPLRESRHGYISFVVRNLLYYLRRSLGTDRDNLFLV